MAGDQSRRSDFFPADFGGPADFPAMPHIGTLARLIIKYPACQLLGKSCMELGTACMYVLRIRLTGVHVRFTELADNIILTGVDTSTI